MSSFHPSFSCQKLFWLLILIFTTGRISFTQELSERTGALSPEEQLKQFELADGFIIELVASEADGIVNPVDLTFDDAGRLWTQTAKMYPLDPVADIKWNDLLVLMDDLKKQKEHPAFKKMIDRYQGKIPGEDKILILDHLYTTDQSDIRVQTWKDGLTIPMSIMPYKNGAYVAQGSEIFYLDDKNRDGKSDTRRPLLTGFGFTDTHTMAHSLVRAPGGWIHFSQGALNKGMVRSMISGDSLRINYSKIARFSMNGRKIELVNAGLNNIWGLQLRNNGQWFGIEANDLGYSVVPMEPGSAFPGIGNDKLRPYQPFLPELHKFRVGGTGLSGLAFADDPDGSFPDNYKDVAFLANPITNSINAVHIVREPNGKVKAEILDDLLTCHDDWFRPVNIEFGPDGCLYIADWYNKIVSHNEVPTTNPDRDKSHGRIWRIRHISQKPRKIPDFYTVPTSELPAYLKSSSLWAKRAAWNQIAERDSTTTQSIIPELMLILSDNSNDEITHIHALWSLESLNYFDSKMITRLLKKGPVNLQREALRSLVTFHPPKEQLAVFLSSLAEDQKPQIRSQMIRTLGSYGEATPEIIKILIVACKPELEGEEMGGPYERKFERYLARKALENYPDQLTSFLKSPAAESTPLSNRLWALLALPDSSRLQAFMHITQSHEIEDLDESTFVGLVQMAEQPAAYKVLSSVIQRSKNPVKYLHYGLNHQSQIPSPAFNRLISNPVRSLLSGNNPEKVKLALKVINRFNIDGGQKVLVELFKNTKDKSTTNLILKALAQNAEDHQDIFSAVALDDAVDFMTRAAALNILSKVNLEKGQTIFEQWIPVLAEGEKKLLMENYSASINGAKILISSLGKGKLSAQDFNPKMIERMAHILPKDSGIQALQKKLKEDQKSDAPFSQKVLQYMSMTESVSGNPGSGRALFTTCMLCHRVGDQGQDIAPALDGSAYRDKKALLTAILDPNAAVESGYNLYRITLKDGSIMEGYLYEKTENGVTLAVMGGTKTFIQSERIDQKGFVAGRSFMPSGLIEHFSAQQVADLLAYIKTLK